MLQPSQSSALPQRQQFEYYAHSAQALFSGLAELQFFEQVESLQPTLRHRCYSVPTTLAIFISQVLSADSSCQNAVNNYLIQRISEGKTTCSVNTGSYCKARSRLALSVIQSLVYETSQVLQSNTPNQLRWRGRSVCLVDGTTVTLSDTAANQVDYPQFAHHKPGLGFPLCRIGALLCLSSGAVLDTVTAPCKGKRGDELTMLFSMLHNLKPGDILLGDAFYPSYYLLCELQRLGVDGVFEQHGSRRRHSDFASGESLGSRDHLIELKRPKHKGAQSRLSREAHDQLPEKLVVRECCVGGRILVTTLTEPRQVAKRALGQLYKKRWHVELDLRNLKTTLGMEHIASRTPAMANKEIWVYMLAYNLIRLLMLKAGCLTARHPRQLSFKHSVQLCLAWWQQGGYRKAGTLKELLRLIAGVIVGQRPKRIEPRALKRRAKPFPLLKVRREVARESIRQHGHPKKTG